MLFFAKQKKKKPKRSYFMVSCLKLFILYFCTFRYYFLFQWPLRGSKQEGLWGYTHPATERTAIRNESNEIGTLNPI